MLSFRDDPEARLRLFCLPYAGGGTAAFHGWSSILPRSIQVSPIRLPGRESRFAEPPHTSLAQLVGEVADALAHRLDKAFAIFGHSMGGTIAFEVVRELRRRGCRSPVRLFASGCRAPHRPPGSAALSRLPPDTLLAAVRQRYGGIPEATLEDSELLDLIVPVLRADLALVESYRYEEGAPLDCPISVLGGSNDGTLSDVDLAEWDRHTTAPLDMCMLSGGHFFLRESRDAVLKAIEERLLCAMPLTNADVTAWTPAEQYLKER